MMIESAGRTDIGLVRKSNEDSFKIWDDKELYIVCDGMGGHNAGEVASHTACELVAYLYGSHFEELLTDDRLKLPRIFPPSTDVLAKAVRIANHWIYKKASTDPALTGMGTTIVAAAVEDDIITLLHVGDSRIYRYFDGVLEPLTTDHSWAAEIEKAENISPEEAKQLVNRNVITRALGVKDSVEVDVAVRRLVDGEIYIMCSDGLCGFVEDDDIRRAVSGCHNNVETIAHELIELANGRGGSDNSTVVAMKVVGKVEKSNLPEIATVTVDAEPSDYYLIEEEWAMVAENPTIKTDDVTGKVTKSHGFNVFGFFATVIIMAILAGIFYIIFKG